MIIRKSSNKRWFLAIIVAALFMLSEIANTISMKKPITLLFLSLSSYFFIILSFIIIKIILDNKAKKLSEEIRKKRKIICEGFSTFEGKGGYLFLSEVALEFYSHKLNFNAKNFYILAKEIRSVTFEKGKLYIKTNEQELKFITDNSQLWSNYIKEQLEHINV